MTIHLLKYCTYSSIDVCCIVKYSGLGKAPLRFDTPVRIDTQVRVDTPMRVDTPVRVDISVRVDTLGLY